MDRQTDRQIDRQTVHGAISNKVDGIIQHQQHWQAADKSGDLQDTGPLL